MTALTKCHEVRARLEDELTAANERIRELEAELNALKYSYQLDEELIGMIQKVITVLNSRPVPTTSIHGEQA